MGFEHESIFLEFWKSGVGIWIPIYFSVGPCSWLLSKFLRIANQRNWLRKTHKRFSYFKSDFFKFLSMSSKITQLIFSHAFFHYFLSRIYTYWNNFCSISKYIKVINQFAEKIDIKFKSTLHFSSSSLTIHFNHEEIKQYKFLPVF